MVIKVFLGIIVAFYCKIKTKLKQKEKSWI